MFGIDSAKCFVDYQATKKSAGEDFVELAGGLSIVGKELHYKYLSEFGVKELDFILMYMHQKLGVKRVQFLGHMANILLIFLPPAEVFFVLQQLVDRTGKIKCNKDTTEKQRLRWHIPTDAEDQAQLIATFIDVYIGLAGERRQAILEKCHTLELNFDLIIHSLLNSLMTSILPLDIAINIFMIFLKEGQKALFRFMISVLDLNYKIISKLTTKKDFLITIKTNTFREAQMQTLLREAFAIKLVTTGS